MYNSTQSHTVTHSHTHTLGIASHHVKGDSPSEVEVFTLLAPRGRGGKTASFSLPAPGACRVIIGSVRGCR